MALRNIVLEGDPILRKRCRAVDQVDDRIRMILDDMVETMREAGGVGLAAPQVGMMRRMFVAEPEEGRVYCFVNPEIIEMEGSQLGDEGCLSVPGYQGKVERPERIRIKGLDREGKEQEYEFRDWDARVMCHEFDHLEGILYTDKAGQVYEVTAEGDE
ncbi:peptide deformylase [bacterium 210820-DFI.6.37]|nr:peptide deformylase [bacterium 210820-DFI.6.37]